MRFGDLGKAEALLAIPKSLDPGELTPFVQAHSARLRARLDAARGDERGIEERFKGAAALFRGCDMVFHVAVTQLEHAEWLAERGRSDEAHVLLVEAQATFDQLRAIPWLERVGLSTAITREPAAAFS